jgi:hypothetical protein
MAKEKFENSSNQLSMLLYAEKIISLINMFSAMNKPQPESVILILFEEKLFLKIHSIVEKSNVPCIFNWMNRRKEEFITEHNNCFYSLLGFTQKSFRMFIELQPYLQFGNY